MAVAEAARGVRGRGGPVGEAAALSGGVGGLNGLELRLGRVIPVEVVVLIVTRDG